MMKNIYQFGSYALGKPMPRFSLAHFIRKLMTAIFHEVIIGHSLFTRISSRFVKAGSLLFLMTMFVSHLVAQSSEKLQISINEDEKFQTLQVGDDVPEEIWELPLRVINHPYGKDTVTLNDYRENPVVILDFWATTCGSCLQSLKDIRKMKDTYQSVIVLITEQAEETIKGSNSFKYRFENYNPYTVVEDKLLSGAFGVLSLPHVVWIANDKIKSITFSPAVTEENIHKAIKNNVFPSQLKGVENHNEIGGFNSKEAKK